MTLTYKCYFYMILINFCLFHFYNYNSVKYTYNIVLCSTHICTVYRGICPHHYHISLLRFVLCAPSWSTKYQECSS